MPYLNCPDCGMEQNVPREMLGLVVDCPKCRSEFRAEDDSPAGNRGSTRGRRRSSGGSPWTAFKWIALFVGGGFVLVGLARPSVHSAALSAIGCFCAIASRIFQAEEHAA